VANFKVVGLLNELTEGAGGLNSEWTKQLWCDRSQMSQLLLADLCYYHFGEDVQQVDHSQTGRLIN